jgi:hypothetical protein
MTKMSMPRCSFNRQKVQKSTQQQTRGCFTHILRYELLKTLLWLWNIEQYKPCPITLLYFVSKCKVGKSLMFIYIHILSYYKLFLYFTLCLSVKLDSLSCSFTSISFLRDRPFILQGGGLWFFVSFRIFFSDNTRVRIFFFLSNRYAILWEVFLDPSDSDFLFADLVGFYTHWTYMWGYHKWALAHSSSC